MDYLKVLTLDDWGKPQSG